MDLLYGWNKFLLTIKFRFPEFIKIGIFIKIRSNPTIYSTQNPHYRPISAISIPWNITCPIPVVGWSISILCPLTFVLVHDARCRLSPTIYVCLYVTERRTTSRGLNEHGALSKRCRSSPLSMWTRPSGSRAYWRGATKSDDLATSRSCRCCVSTRQDVRRTRH